MTFLDRHAGVAGIALLVLVWELAARCIWRDPSVLPAPTESVMQAWSFLTWPVLLGHVGTSLGRILAGFAIAAVLGVALGTTCGWFRMLGAIVRPFIEVLRPIPPLAWIPLAIVWFGLGEQSKIFVIALGAFFPIFTNAYRGVSLIPPVLLRAAQTMDVDGLKLLWKIAIPAAMPDVAVGLRVGFGLAFGVLVAAELIAAERGMGHLIMEARQLGHLGVSIFGILLIGCCGMFADWLLAAAIVRWVGRWARI